MKNWIGNLKEESAIEKARRSTKGRAKTKINKNKQAGWKSGDKSKNKQERFLRDKRSIKKNETEIKPVNNLGLLNKI